MSFSVTGQSYRLGRNYNEDAFDVVFTDKALFSATRPQRLAPSPQGSTGARGLRTAGTTATADDTITVIRSCVDEVVIAGVFDGHGETQGHLVSNFLSNKTRHSVIGPEHIQYILGEIAVLPPSRDSDAGDGGDVTNDNDCGLITILHQFIRKEMTKNNLDLQAYLMTHDDDIIALYRRYDQVVSLLESYTAGSTASVFVLYPSELNLEQDSIEQSRSVKKRHEHQRIYQMTALGLGDSQIVLVGANPGDGMTF